MNRFVYFFVICMAVLLFLIPRSSSMQMGYFPMNHLLIRRLPTTLSASTFQNKLKNVLPKTQHQKRVDCLMDTFAKIGTAAITAHIVFLFLMATDLALKRFNVGLVKEPYVYRAIAGCSVLSGIMSIIPRRKIEENVEQAAEYAQRQYVSPMMDEINSGMKNISSGYHNMLNYNRSPFYSSYSVTLDDRTNRLLAGVAVTSILSMCYSSYVNFALMNQSNKDAHLFRSAEQQD